MIKQKDSITARFFRFILSIVILSALIVGIALLVKGIHGFNGKEVASISSKLLSKANINVNEDQIGEVAGKFVERVSNTNISASATSRVEERPFEETSPLLVEVGIIADVQEDYAALTQSLSKLKDRHINKVIVLGDLTNYGELSALTEVKRILDESGLTYYALPGDHDLAATLNTDNFTKVFGKTNYVIDVEGFNMLLLDNSANYTTLPSETISWFNSEVKTADFVFLSQPLFTDGLNLPFSKMYMGSTRSEIDSSLEEKQIKVKAQRDILLDSLRNSNTFTVFGADHHKSSILKDSVNSSLEHRTLGAIASELNDLPQKLLQSPRFSVLNIYTDRSYKVEEILLD